MSGSPDGFGLYQLAAVLGVGPGMINQASESGLLPKPDRAGRWSDVAAALLRKRWPQIVSTITQAQELGAARCAELLSRATGLPVIAADITELDERGILPGSRRYRHRPLYRVADVQAPG